MRICALSQQQNASWKLARMGAKQSKKTHINPFPDRVPSEGTGISESVPTSPRPSAGRSRTTLGRVRVRTMDNHQIFPTARRRARTLALRGAPESTVGDVPTAPRGEGAVTSFHVRARPREELRLTVRHQCDQIRLS